MGNSEKYSHIEVIRKYRIKVPNCSKLSKLAELTGMRKDEIINYLIEQAYGNAMQPKL